jgi:hypothetical protein
MVRRGGGKGWNRATGRRADLIGVVAARFCDTGEKVSSISTGILPCQRIGRLQKTPITA